MFAGMHFGTLDDKGRMKVPRGFRDVMEDRDQFVWYVTLGYRGNLDMYSKNDWHNICQQLQSLSPTDPVAQDS